MNFKCVETNDRSDKKHKAFHVLLSFVLKTHQERAFESRCRADRWDWRRRWDSNPRLDLARPWPSTNVRPVLKKRTARPQKFIDIRYYPPVLLSLLGSDAGFVKALVYLACTCTQIGFIKGFVACINSLATSDSRKLRQNHFCCQQKSSHVIL
jgi:hypothetical protein